MQLLTQDPDRQRIHQIAMLIFGAVRVVGWSVLLLLFLCHVGFADNLFGDLRFIGAISVVALIETAFGQFAASWAGLIGTEVHDAVEELDED